MPSPMYLRTLLVLPVIFLATLSNALGQQADSGKSQAAATPASQDDVTLAGTLKVHPKYLYRHYLTDFGAGQQCALLGLEELGELEPGSRIRVTGHLVVHFHPGGNQANPSPFPSTYFIAMEVNSVEVLAEPVSPESRPPVFPGLTLQQVVSMRGTHYKRYHGSREGQVFLIYDDFTIEITEGGVGGGRVVSFEATNESWQELAGPNPYVDAILQAKIIALNEPGSIQVTLNSGAADGLNTGDLLCLLEHNFPIAQLEVIQTEPQRSQAKIVSIQGTPKLNVGDTVVRDLTLQHLSQFDPGTSRDDAAQVGERRARADIGNGAARILYYGTPRSQGKPLIDDDTGYPVSVVAGCIVTHDFVQFVDAYNRTMREHFQQNRQ